MAIHLIIQLMETLISILSHGLIKTEWQAELIDYLFINLLIEMVIVRFRAEIEFDNRIYSYDIRQTLYDNTDINVAYVTLQNGQFSISHCLPCK